MAFILTVVFIGLFALNEHVTAEKLREEAKPRLRLVFGKGFAYDSMHNHGAWRKIRVGVVNSGATVDGVAVKLSRVHPELPQFLPMMELQQTHAEEGVSRFTVNKSEEPLVFVEVVLQFVYREDGESSGTVMGEPWARSHKKGETRRMELLLASGGRDLLPPGTHPATRYNDQYLLWLAIDGAGAELPRKFVLRRNELGQYDMDEAFTL